MTTKECDAVMAKKYRATRQGMTVELSAEVMLRVYNSMEHRYYVETRGQYTTVYMATENISPLLLNVKTPIPQAEEE